MAANIEIKARVNNLTALQHRAAALSGSEGVELIQEDIFFIVPRGRLKLRIFNSQHGELIFYERADQAGPRQSNYQLSRTNEPGTLKEALTLALGMRGVVRKRRLLFLVGQTRIHLDDVENLGHFMELEYVLGTDETPENGLMTVQHLMDQLGIAAQDLLDRAYVDLLDTNG